MKIEIRYTDQAPRDMLQRAPDFFRQRLDQAMQRGARVIAQQAKANIKGVGKGTLTQSITVRQISSLHWQVSTGTAYARIVEEGSGPAAGRPKYYPNPDALKEWLMTTPSYRGHKWAPPGTAKRGSQELDVWLRSRAWAWGIYQKGTKAYPFMKPAFESKKQEAVDLANQAMRAAVADLNRGTGHVA